jgi:hypothetical protein
MADPTQPSHDDPIAEMYGQTTEDRRISRGLFSIAVAHFFEDNLGAMGKANNAYVSSLPPDKRPVSV